MESRLTVECSSFCGNEEIEAVKRHLHIWGQSKMILDRLQNEIKLLEANMAKLEGLPGKSPANEKVKKSFEDRIRDLAAEAEDIIVHDSAMSFYVTTLGTEKAQVLRLRFVDGVCADAVALRVHTSRASVFRWQKAGLCEIADMMKKAGCLFEKTARFAITE